MLLDSYDALMVVLHSMLLRRCKVAFLSAVLGLPLVLCILADFATHIQPAGFHLWTTGCAVPLVHTYNVLSALGLVVLV